MTTTTDLVAATRPQEQLELDRFARLGQWLYALETGKDPKADPAAAAANALRFFYAEALELPPTAVSQLSVINGNLFIGAELRRYMAEQAGYRVIRLETSPEVCTAAVIRVETGEQLGQTTYTIEEATTAGLVRDRSAWKTHPARMLWARASTLAIRDFAPGVSLGMYGADEIPEVTNTPPVPYDEDPSIPFGDSYDAEAVVVEQLEELTADERGDPGHDDD